VTAARVDALLASEGGYWRPGMTKVAGGAYDGSGNLTCQTCTPCKSGMRDRCIRPNSSTAIAAAKDRARRQSDAERERLLSQATRPTAGGGYALVVDVFDDAAVDAALANRGLRR
jgi:hypothetical protein